MPRSKRPPVARGRSQPNSRGGRAVSSLETAFIPFAGTSAARGHLGFSLQDEARNTERHAFGWDSDQKLRHSKVNFVSATKFDTAFESNKYPEYALASISLESPVPAPALCTLREELSMEVVVQEEETEVLVEEGFKDFSPPSKDPAALGFFVDTLGEPQHTGLPPLQLRSFSPTPSNSSEEVILFNGRDKAAKSRSPNLPKARIDQIDAKIIIVEDKIQKQQDSLGQTVRSRESPIPDWDQPADAVTVKPDAAPANFEPILPRREGRGSRRNRSNHRRTKQEEEDALIADYLLNMNEEDNDLVRNMSFGQRELGGTHDTAWQEEAEVSFGQLQASKKRSEGGWERSDICDFDDMSTSDGVMGEIQAIFSKRERDSGLQYLVVWQDQTVNEARWVPVSTLTSIAALAHIDDFENEEKLIAEFQDNNLGVSSDSEDIDEDGGDDKSDEEDLIQRKIERMTDEQIARLLAKQDELRMGSNELLLFDDATDDDDAPLAPKNSFSPWPMFTSNCDKRSQINSCGAKRPSGKFPAATALADAYDGFDVIDFERPSLKKKPKGRKGLLVLDLSDSELEASTQSAWSNDRVKKRERKQEREELRAQGLLGSKDGKPDLKRKYKEGMGFQAVKEEIKVFLMGGNTTLALPSMDKADRKIVHEIANAFNLKSKSAGNGQTRYPILYRTSRTSAYLERTFAAVEARVTRRFLPRIDVSGKKSVTKRAGCGFNSAAVSYRDGDIVGGSAPELGVENKGRAMLEKMGWSTGTALGAINNKGILQPVSHVVKTTKAGLG